MRPHSKISISLALVSAVATVALTSFDAEAQRNRRPNLPSVEIHLEVLSSLRQTQENRRMAGYNTPSRGRVAVPSSPVSTGDSFASHVSREISSGRATPTVRAPMKSKVIMQPLPRTASSSTSGEVIMQPLPKRVAAESTEEIIMQPVPSSEMAFPIADVPITEESTTAGIIAAEAMAEAVEEEPGFFDRLAGIFSSDEKEVAKPELRQPPVKSEVVSLPKIVEMEEKEDSFFSTVQEEIVDAASAEQVVEDVKVETVEPLQPVATKPMPQVDKLYEPKMADNLPVPGGFVVVEKEHAAKQPARQPIVRPVRPTPAITPSIVEPTPDSAFEPTPVLPSRALALPVEKETEEFPRLSSVESAPELEEELQALPNSAQEWLSEDSAPAVASEPPISAMVKEVPAEPPTTILDELLAENKIEPVAPQPKLAEPAPKVQQETIVQNLPEPEPLIVADPAPEPIVAPVFKSPELEPQQIPEPVIAEPEVMPAEELEALIQETQMTNAEENFLSNAASAESEPIAEPVTDLTPMEQALEEVEPVIEPVAPAPTEAEEDFALLDDMVTPEPSPSPVNQPKAEGFLPGITKTFKGMLGGAKETPAVAPPVSAPAPAPIADPVIPEIQETTENVLPPELPVAEDQSDSLLPSMELLEDDLGTRFGEETLDLGEMEPIAVPAEPPQMQQIAEEEFEVASLPKETEPTSPPAQSSALASDLRILYGVDDTDIPDAQKSELSSIAQKAKQSGNRVIISSFASGEEDESKAANMISLSRGLSLRAFFIDQGIAMDRIIVQAKGLENAGGPADRAEISLD